MNVSLLLATDYGNLWLLILLALGGPAVIALVALGLACFRRTARAGVWMGYFGLLISLAMLGIYFASSLPNRSLSEWLIPVSPTVVCLLAIGVGVKRARASKEQDAP